MSLLGSVPGRVPICPSSNEIMRQRANIDISRGIPLGANQRFCTFTSTGDVKKYKI